MRLKVCGMTAPEQVHALEEMGVTFAGFIFYPKSPRYALRHMTTLQIKSFRNIHKVGVFVNADEDHIRAMVDECRLQMVQLHGDETPKFCEKIADYISVVKAFRVTENDHMAYRTREYMDSCDMFLFDTGPAAPADGGRQDQEQYGGTGRKFNWDLLTREEMGKPYFLSGGIGPDDAPALSHFMQHPNARGLFALDVNSKFETAPGIKNLHQIKDFYKQIQLL